MGARMLGDISWDAKGVYATPKAADRYTAWWSREYFGAHAPAAESVYNKYFTLLDRPDSMWTPMVNIQTLISDLYHKVGGDKFDAFPADTVAQLQTRAKSLDDALASEQKAESAMPLTERRFFSIDAGLGLEIADYQTHAALKLEEASRAADAAAMWKSVFEARGYLEQLETDFARGEYAPFDRWYAQSWIRSAVSNNNPHRAYNQLRDFIGQDGHGSLAVGPGRGGFGPGRGAPGAGPGRGAPIPR